MLWFGSLNSFLVKQEVNEINMIYNTVGEKDQSKIVVWITIKLYYENSYDFFVTLRIIAIKTTWRLFYNQTYIMYNAGYLWSSKDLFNKGQECEALRGALQLKMPQNLALNL